MHHILEKVWVSLAYHKKNNTDKHILLWEPDIINVRAQMSLKSTRSRLHRDPALFWELRPPPILNGIAFPAPLWKSPSQLEFKVKPHICRTFKPSKPSLIWTELSWHIWTWKKWPMTEHGIWLLRSHLVINYATCKCGGVTFLMGNLNQWDSQDGWKLSWVLPSVGCSEESFFLFSLSIDFLCVQCLNLLKDLKFLFLFLILSEAIACLAIAPLSSALNPFFFTSFLFCNFRFPALKKSVSILIVATSSVF